VSRLWKGILWALAIEASAVGVIWTAVRVAGTGWAVWFALVMIAVFGVTAIPRRQRP
jgi:hypothetical protein